MFRFLILSIFSLIFASCASQPSAADSNRPSVPRVRMPDLQSLSSTEQRLIPEVEDALIDAGYRPTVGNAEYQLQIRLSSGPVNADSFLALYRGGEEVARAQARRGGPRIIFQRTKVVEESFRQCLMEFQMQLPRNPQAIGGNLNGGTPAFDGASGQADWQRGWAQ